MMRNRQGRFAFNPTSPLKEQFEAIAAWNATGCALLLTLLGMCFM